MTIESLTNFRFTHKPRTDLGNAERFAKQHRNDLRYCADRNKWLVWDRSRWRIDATGQVIECAKETARSIYDEAKNIDNTEESHKTAQWAFRSQSQARISAMISLAQTEPGMAVVSADLNADPWLLNCENGTIDLHSGDLRPHRREDLITKLVPVEYDPGARHPLWERFLDEITDGDVEKKDFLQRAAGYSLTGDTSEEVLFFVHGPAASGKSTFMEAIKRTLGDYAMTADFDSFVKRRRDSGGPRSDIARLATARLVASIEVDRGEKLAEGLVKGLTGGDTITSRFMYEEYFEFRPPFKLWLVANHKPAVDDDDDAMWRRIIRVPFDHVIPKERRDPTVKKSLCDPTEAGPAILAWAVQGCLDWQRLGLRVPHAIEEATEAYRLEMDPLQDFVSDCCVLTPLAWTTSAQLREAYDRWLAETGQRRLTDREMTHRLRLRDCTPEKRCGMRGWSGIGLADRLLDWEERDASDPSEVAA
jgi:putative DNA primase/helicase